MQDPGLVQNNSQLSPNAAPAGIASSVVSNSSGSGSPWDDDVDDLPLSSKGNPTIVGTLAPAGSAPKQVDQSLKVPDNIEEKVGVKVPASNYMNVPSQPQAVVSAPVPPVLAPTAPTQISSPSPAPSAAPTSVSSSIPAEPMPAVKDWSEDTFFGDQEDVGKGGDSTQVVQPVNPDRGRQNYLQDLKSSVLPSKMGGSEKLISKKQSVPVQNSPEPKNVTNMASIRRIIFSSIFVVLLLFCATVTLTELGLLSIGAEKIYGPLKIEKLWGGLPSKTESALAVSALQTSKHTSFKINGKMTLTVDSSIKSDITAPLLSLKNGRLLARDTDISKSVRTEAIMAATDGTVPDVYVYDQVDTASTTSSATSGSTVTSTSDTSTSATTSSGSETSSTSTNQDEVTSEKTNISTVESTVESEITDGASEAIIDLGDENGTKLYLVNRKNQLYFKKTSNNQTDAEKASQKWSTYDISTLKDKDIQTGIFNLKTDLGFSAVGERVGNEKVNGVRCFKYQIKELEIGNSLSGFGITSDLIQGASGYVYIGIKDKLMRRVDLQITTPVASAVSMIKIDLVLSHFDVQNQISEVKTDETPAATTPATTTTETPTSTPATTVTLTGDAKRKADVNSILSALAAYKAVNKSYLISNDLLKLNSNDNMIVKALVPKYLAEMPTDPKSGWYYAYKSDGKKCSVSARLENSSDPEGTLVSGVLLYLKYNNN